MKILTDDRPVTFSKLRVDLLKCPLLKSCRDILEAIEESKHVGIEVQTLVHEETGWPKFTTVGFCGIAKNATGNSVAKSVIQEAPTKFFIRATEWGKSYIIEGKDTLFNLIEQLADDSKWANERPIITLQMGGKKTGGGKKA
jgi:hypothetical protein